jgi:hypothetical protein
MTRAQEYRWTCKCFDRSFTRDHGTLWVCSRCRLPSERFYNFYIKEQPMQDNWCRCTYRLMDAEYPYLCKRCYKNFKEYMYVCVECALEFVLNFRHPAFSLEDPLCWEHIKNTDPEPWDKLPSKISERLPRKVIPPKEWKPRQTSTFLQAIRKSRE